MKMINFSGITESLSASEMKLVKGGNPPKSLEVNEDVPEGGSGGSHYCFRCMNGKTGKCTGGDCIGELNIQCPGGWTSWSC